MRYPRPKPSIALAAIAAAVVASPFVVIASQSEPQLVDNKQTVSNTEIEQVPLRELPAAIVDVATSGLAAAGVELPPIDPDAFPLPDLTVPLPKGLVPGAGSSSSTDPSAPSGSPSRESSAESSPPESPSAESSPPETSSETTEPAATPTTEAPSSSERSAPSTTREQPAPRGDRAPGTPTRSNPSSTTPATPTMADGREVGAAVTHIVREAPIKMVAFTWERPVDVDLKLRAKNPDGKWGPWTVLEQISRGQAPSAKNPVGTEPVWVGDAREVQVAASKDGLAIPAAETQGGDLAQLAVGTASTVVTELATVALNALKATLISPESLLGLGSSLLSPLTGGPQVVARQAWGADESIRCSQPVYSPQMRGAIVHHTAGSNDYTPQQSAEIVRGIYAYHARSLNWCDIGYNVLIDKYGQIFEGAFGGLDRNVEGTHTGGFNKETLGVSMIGNLEEAPPTAAMVSATGKFLRWRLGKAGLNPAGTATLTSEGFAGTKFAAGTQSNLPVISGHRDYNSTSCPGVHGYAALTAIRALAGGAPPAPEPTPPADPAAPAPPPAAPGAPAPPVEPGAPAPVPPAA
ncbi:MULTISPECIES: N-acetylmuramoyl-L-alanine amidase [Gordonia]|uniref:peptidoglycan recognition protein family protein n=1 Tax=Gordonia TaxID=2053 RepID=UPI00080E847F|nr:MULTISPECIES: N-acetylmuramoyl-L-alanine amidase [Gordonia]MBN0971045.1 N-acetylmuramoyl-L-alanine amidase [Gordonia sp. BP-119]MBN0982375.1 N-acetylmuramoyl-L-alanine amidase [Gordonia sp. BP-94]MCT1354344.1 N-acetylmuramoyl-L-alanine amidase [Gordonia sp. p3-SID1431]OCH80683.1 N-acetylmuramoyl-L-alanine amidase [Gordonia sp. UCD-TK1]UCZ88544.1 N-acetylmuramoyl-L-alanine amidase [Gordonia sp. WA4-43]